MNEGIEPYFSGELLWGDDFDTDEVEAWFDDEMEAYAGMFTAHGADEQNPHAYPYHALNRRHGYRTCRAATFGTSSALGAHGSDLIPILDRIERITVLEPSVTHSHRRPSPVCRASM